MIVPLAMAFALPPVEPALRTPSRSEGDAAVVIGIEDYVFLPDVPHAGADAAAFEDLLIRTRGIPPDRVQRLGAASREQILAAVSRAAELAGPGATVWITFAGHGAASPSDGRRLLLGDDARQDPTVFEARGVPLDELEAVATSRGSQVISVVDACFNGKTRTGEAVAEGTRMAVPAWVTEPPAGAVTWTASGPDQLARPLDPAGHGAFSYLVLGALRGWADGELDGRTDGRVSAAEAHRYVQRGLRELGITDQVPVLRGDDGRVLVEGVSEPAPQLEPPRREPATGQQVLRVDVPAGYHPDLVATAAGYGITLPLEKRTFGYRDAAGEKVSRQRIHQLARSTPRGRRSQTMLVTGLALTVPGWIGATVMGPIALFQENAGLGAAAGASLAVAATGIGLTVAGATGLERAVQPDFRASPR